MEMASLSPTICSRLLQRSYTGGTFWQRSLLTLRPFICPFEEILRRIPRGQSVLDVGCGMGAVSTLVAAYCAPRRVLGIDVNEAAITQARNAIYAREGVVEFQTMPATELPQRTFDLILCIDVLHHVPREQQRDWLQRLVTLLTPDGVLLLKDVSSRPAWKAAMSRLHDIVLARQWVHPRAEEVVIEWLSAKDGRVLECTRCDRLWYSHYLLRWQRV